MRPLSSDLREFIRLLNTKSLKYVIVGAWAVTFHGRPRYTGDLDVFVSRDDANADRLMEVMNAFGFGKPWFSLARSCRCSSRLKTLACDYLTRWRSIRTKPLPSLWRNNVLLG